MSGEIQADVADAYREARNAIESEIDRLLEDVSLMEKAEKWAFIAIIRKEDSPDYDEIVKRSSRGKVLEFRLKIPHAQFLAASPNERIDLILKALCRSVKLMGQLDVSAETTDRLQAILLRAEGSLVSRSM